MIRITLSNIVYDDRAVLEDDSRKKVVVQVEGHAGAGVKGNDPVCAAVSALAGTLVIGISRIAGISQKVQQREGFIRTEIALEEASPGKRETLFTMLDFFLIGILEIKRTADEALTVIFKSKEI